MSSERRLRSWSARDVVSRSSDGVPSSSCTWRAGEFPRPPDIRLLVAGAEGAWRSFLEFFRSFAGKQVVRWLKDYRDLEDVVDQLIVGITLLIRDGKGPSRPNSHVPWLKR